MSDSQRQVKMMAEQALANLVERAKRLQLCSVSSIDLSEEHDKEDTGAAGQSEGTDDLLDTTITMQPSRGPRKTSKSSSQGATTHRPVAPTARKQRKLDLEPSPPPPPSPRDLGMIAELRDEYNQTEQLIDQMITDAANLNRDVITRSQHQRDLSLVQQIELETTTRSLDTLFDVLNGDLGSKDLHDVMQRCDHALERTKQRYHDETIIDDKHNTSNVIKEKPMVVEELDNPVADQFLDHNIASGIEQREQALGDCKNSSLLAKEE